MIRKYLSLVFSKISVFFLPWLLRDPFLYVCLPVHRLWAYWIIILILFYLGIALLRIYQNLPVILVQTDDGLCDFIDQRLRNDGLTETSAAPEGGGGARFFLRLERTGATGSSSKGLVLSTLNREPDNSLRAIRGVMLKTN